ncbi:MAG: transglycosylase SLT domain-containing protein, partial [Acidimicrobiia bacterium]|nr:transglycosylase SLT domain-containing protein [Acidimicrobiia bacterium]
LAVLVALSIVFSTLAVPALADVSTSDIHAAESLAGEAAARLRVAEGDLAAAERRMERLEESLSSVGERLEDQDVEIVAGRAEALDRIARMYMTAGGSDISGLLGLARISDLPAHIAYLGALADQDRRFVNQLVASRADLERLGGVIEENMAEQAGIISELAAVVEVRRAEVDAARAEVSAVEAQWQRQEDERRAREEAERVRQQQEEQHRQEAAEQARREEEARQQAALAAIEAAAASASAAGWTPGSGVEPWRPLVRKYFPADMVDDALSVMRCESHGDPLSLNRYSAASGLFQHLPYYWPSRSKAAGWDGADIFDPEANIAVAAWLVNRTVVVEGREPWGHWVCKP